ncbi:hypothetical protein [Zongyangia hominis]|uniref:Peptidyl-prolyl cis-trans isomerase n=1 Tax=Zongyangia hominis TaxID=2763677 RepID=A0A926EET7_9FIRM|nr:hypothetical protein [Zongyangia hominis]MBC8570566.1 hypothetical protein [Zongyangia hominis]
MKLGKKILAAVMAMCMVALTFAGCAGQDTTWIATDKEGNKVPIGIYLYQRFEAYTEALDLAEDKGSDAWGQQIEGKSCYDWVNDKATQAVKEYVAVEEKFKEGGYTLAEEQQAYAEQQAANRYNYYSGLYDANGISLDSITAIYLNNMKRSVIFQETYSPGGSKGLSEDDLKNELKDNYLRFKVVMVSKDDTEGKQLGEEDLKKAEASRDEYLKRAQAGEDFDKLIIESEDVYLKAKAGDENYEPTDSDYGHKHTNKDAHLTIMRKDSTNASADLLDAIAKAANGTFGKAEDTDYYYVFQKLDITEEIDTTIKTLEAQLTSDLKADDFDVEVAEWAENTQMTFNDKAISQHKNKQFKKGKAAA